MTFDFNGITRRNELSVSEAIRNRCSIRAFTPKKIPEDIFRQIIEAGRLAPSGSNCQPAYLIVIKSTELKKQIVEHTGYKGPEHRRRRQKFILSASNVVAVVVNPYEPFRILKWNQSHPINMNRQKYILAATRDGSIVADHIVLQATALGVSTCFMSWFDQEPVKQLLMIPEEHYIVTFIAFGYQRANVSLEKNRKSLDDFVFLDAFNNNYRI